MEKGRTHILIERDRVVADGRHVPATKVIMPKMGQGKSCIHHNKGGSKSHRPWALAHVIKTALKVDDFEVEYRIS